MKRDVTIRALLQRERKLHPRHGAAAPAAVWAKAVHRQLKASSRPGVASARDRRATWRATVDRLVAKKG